MILTFCCPKCFNKFRINGYWRWILKAPFHCFDIRYTKCPHCEKRSWMSWYKIEK